MSALKNDLIVLMKKAALKLASDGTFPPNSTIFLRDTAISGEEVEKLVERRKT